MPASPLHAPTLEWYARAARDLPWRRPGTAPWNVLVSEVMLQQTPVSRVLPAYALWTGRWPGPRELAAEAAGEAVRQWGRLGYPRRALRLHEAATVVVERHAGVLPSGLAELRLLPGVGAYTAAAVASFAFGQRHAVLDTNVRRVLARALAGEANAGPTISAGETLRAESVLPEDPARAATWAVATMELGALVCTARAPRCADCPLAGVCAWRAAGYPGASAPARRPQGFAGTDRQVRGRLLAVVRDSPEPVEPARLEREWELPEQRERALAALVADGLVQRRSDGRYTLPGSPLHSGPGTEA